MRTWRHGTRRRIGCEANLELGGSPERIAKQIMACHRKAMGQVNRLHLPSVTITTLPTSSGFVMPDDEQLKRLAQIVIAKVPWVGDVSGPAFYGSDQRANDWLKQYRAAFTALGAFKRTEEPNHKVYLSYWVTALEAYLRTIGNHETLRQTPSCAPR